MGALAPRSGHTRPSPQAPIDTSGNLSFFPEKTPHKKSIPRGAGGGPKFLFTTIYFFGDLKPYNNISGRIVIGAEERRKKAHASCTGQFLRSDLCAWLVPHKLRYTSTGVL
jgi:hypothetical protein